MKMLFFYFFTLVFKNTDGNEVCSNEWDVAKIDTDTRFVLVAKLVRKCNLQLHIIKV